MLDFGWPELLLIAIVLIVVVGPKDLPRVLRSFGRTTTKLRGMAGDFRKQFDEAMREAELDDVKNFARDVKELDPRNELKKHMSPLRDAERDIRSGLNDAAKPKSSTDKSESAAAPAKTEQAKEAGTKVSATPAKSGPSKASPAKSTSAKATPAKTGDKKPAATTAGKSPSKSTAKPAAKKASAPKKTAAKPVGNSGTKTDNKTNAAASSQKKAGTTS
ncbi:Sec-independent protein translocase protein TatB [Chelativorans sp. YIM 93263]|uniref:Sec-independent protein translocase protein TatB n=1 Tax=Chelativorans sp. YIM 93263 TaxID=2906648 RepID=UPI0023780BAE|nr:Sec-independent protein translocase protein TatB [Chelativorans sp. YIM 93263]